MNEWMYTISIDIPNLISTALSDISIVNLDSLGKIFCINVFVNA